MRAQQKPKSDRDPLTKDTTYSQHLPLCDYVIWLQSNCPESGLYSLGLKNDSNSRCRAKGRLAIYFTLNLAEKPGNPMRFLDTGAHLNDPVITLNKPGFYAVRLWSVGDSVLTMGEFSEWIAVDYCPLFEIPTEFRFSSGNQQALFSPSKSRHLDKIDFVLFDPMGAEVFQTHEPDFRWNLRRMDNGQPVESGIYYYSCTLYEKSLTSPRKSRISGSIQIKMD